MSSWKYRKNEPSNIRGTCVRCGKNPQKKKIRRGREIYLSLCSYCDNGRTSKRKQHYERKPYRVHLKDCCEKCGFEPMHVCQLDIDHVDGDHNNNNSDNLQTLCANCHRLKTVINKDWQQGT